MVDVELITAIRSLRKLIVTLDSIGLPLKELVSDEEIATMISKDLSKNLKKVASDIHSALQKIEKSKRYKDAIMLYCDVKVRK
jgi:DNA-binding transcriptional MerR regulator